MARLFEDVVYRDLAGYPAELHRRFQMDVYAPDESVATPRAGFPALLWLHGGAMTFNDKRADNNPNVGARLAAHGVVAAMINYRYATQVAFPGFALDALEAMKWLRDHGRQQLGLSLDLNRLFLGGHSAGAYIAGIAGFSEALHREVGLQPGQPAGLVLISGQMSTHFTLCGQLGHTGRRVDEMAPIYLMHKNAPPTLFMIAANDMELREQENHYASEVLRTLGCRHVEYHRIFNRDHGTVYSNMDQPGDEAFERVLLFLRRF